MKKLFCQLYRWSQRAFSSPFPAAQDTQDKHVSAQSSKKKPFSSSGWIKRIYQEFPWDLGTSHQDPRTRKTAFAQGRSWLSSGLKAPLMPCQKRLPARKPGLSHATGTRKLPIWIEKHKWNSWVLFYFFSSLLCHLHFCTAALRNRTLPGRRAGKAAKIHGRKGDGLSTKAFFLKEEKPRQVGVKGLKGSSGKSTVKAFFFYWLAWIPVGIGVYCFPHLQSYEPGAHTASASPL